MTRANDNYETRLDADCAATSQKVNQTFLEIIKKAERGVRFWRTICVVLSLAVLTLGVLLCLR